MSESNPIEGPRSPIDKSTKKKGPEPDPEKFKELLKTDESDETKKQKKQTQDLEEELEEEELDEEEINERASVFQSFMQDTTQLSDSLYETQDTNQTNNLSSPQKQNQEKYNQIYYPQKRQTKTKQPISKIPSSQTPVSESTPKYEKDKKKKQKINTFEQANKLEKKDSEQNQLIKADAKKIRDTQTYQEKTTTQQSITKSKNLRQVNDETTSPITHSKNQPPSQSLKTKKDQIQPPFVPIHNQKKIKDTKEAQTEKIQEKKKKKVLQTDVLEPKGLNQKQKDQKKIEQKDKPQDTKSQDTKSQDTKSQDTKSQDTKSQDTKPKDTTDLQVTTQESIQDAAAASTSLSSTTNQSIQGVDTVSKSSLNAAARARNMPIYSTFSKSQFSLFQKLVGLITIETLKGVQKTEITLSMKNSIFNGLVVRLDHYDTNPHMFNLNFFCSPQAQEALIANIPNLAQAFEQGNFSFKVNIQTPSLLKEKKIKKVEKSTKESL